MLKGVCGGGRRKGGHYEFRKKSSSGIQTDVHLFKKRGM